MSSGWSLYVILLSLLNIFACVWLLLWARSKRVEAGTDGTLGHDFDGIQELDTPLPRWWLWLFVGTIVFSLVYLALYPGLGAFSGMLGWTSQGQYEQEVQDANARYGPLYAAYAAKPIPDLAKDDGALKIGGRVFANNCATCHGSDARGGVGFPNLTDHDWLYGGEPETIELSVLDGRGGPGRMPAWGPVLGDQGVAEVVAYVRGMSGQKVDAALAKAGEAKFAQNCQACHGPDGKGMPVLGSPNLTDDVWLYGGNERAVTETVRNGRGGAMPAWSEILGPEKTRLVAAYVYSLSQKAN